MPDKKSLHDIISDKLVQHLDPPLAGLEQELRQAREGLAAGLDALGRRFSETARMELRTALATSLEGLGTEWEGSEDRHRRQFSVLTTAARRILSAGNQASILSALADASQGFCSRSVVFIARGGYLLAWETRNLENRDSSSGIRSTRIPRDSETSLAEACRQLRAVEGDLESHREDLRLVERLGQVRPDKVLCLPVVIRGRCVAVLYTDSVPQTGQPLNPDALTLLVDLSQSRIELHSLEARYVRANRSVPAPDSKAPSPAPLTAEPEPTLPGPSVMLEAVPSRRMEPVIEPVPGPESEALPAPAEATQPEVSPPVPSAPAAGGDVATSELPGDGPPPELEPAAPDDIPTFGTAVPVIPEEPEPRTAEAEEPFAQLTEQIGGEEEEEGEGAEAIEIDLDTIFLRIPEVELEPEEEEEEELEQPQAGLREQAALAAVQGAVAASALPAETPSEAAAEPKAAPVAEPEAETPAAPAGLPGETERLHSDARRFARLLVSEIKLYNEQAVVEGRSHHDLYDRLKKDVDRGRDMYEKRYSQLTTVSVDYYHDELVRILGANDPTTLGSDYPGPRPGASS